MATDMIDPSCFARHAGPWLYEPVRFAAAVEAFRRGRLALRAASESNERRTLYATTRDGIAVIQISGPMLKGESKFADASNTLMVRRAVRAATADNTVRGIMLLIDSPGGEVAGTEELARDVRNAIAAGKAVRAHIDDFGASAAYWVASQAQHITANHTAQIGSIGVVSVIEDRSGAFEAEGIKVHVVSTGPLKGMVDGAPVLDEHLEWVREIVGAVGDQFVGEALIKGRSMTPTQAREASTGRTWLAQAARTMGLIDQVADLDTAMERFAKALPRRVGRSVAEARLRMAE